MIVTPLGKIGNSGIRQMQRAAAERKGRANVWIFPSYSERHVFSPQGDLKADFARGALADSFSRGTYRRFQDQIETTVRESELPLLAFVDPRDAARTHVLLDKMAPKAPFVVEVSTQTDIAIPTLDKRKGGGAAWGMLARALQLLGIGRLNIMGELGFVYRGKKGGCVYIAEENLSSKSAAKVRVLKDLTYPNVNHFA